MLNILWTKVCFAHGGGSFPYTAARIQHGYKVTSSNMETKFTIMDNKVHWKCYFPMHMSFVTSVGLSESLNWEETLPWSYRSTFYPQIARCRHRTIQVFVFNVDGCIFLQTRPYIPRLQGLPIHLFGVLQIDYIMFQVRPDFIAAYWLHYVSGPNWLYRLHFLLTRFYYRCDLPCVLQIALFQRLILYCYMSDLICVLHILLTRYYYRYDLPCVLQIDLFQGLISYCYMSDLICGLHILLTRYCYRCDLTCVLQIALF